MAGAQVKALGPGAPGSAEALSGPQKVAVLLMALGPEESARVLEHLSQEEVEAITLEVAKFEHVDPHLVEQVLAEWRQTERTVHSVAEGGPDFARKMLEKALGPQKASAAFSRIEGRLQRTEGLITLKNADPQQLVTVLSKEHPQSIALILAHLHPSQTATVLQEMDTELASEVLYRMARLDKVTPDVLRAIEESLSAVSEISLAQDMTAAGGPKAVADVLNQLPGAREKELLSGLSQRDQELGEEIENLMFVFEDLIDLDDQGIQRLVSEVDAKELALALKAASDALKDRIMSTMSERAASALREEMEFLGPQRLKDVEAAQASIVKTARQLAEDGEIVIGSSDDIVVE